MSSQFFTHVNFARQNLAYGISRKDAGLRIQLLSHFSPCSMRCSLGLYNPLVFNNPIRKLPWIREQQQERAQAASPFAAHLRSGRTHSIKLSAFLVPADFCACASVSASRQRGYTREAAIISGPVMLIGSYRSFPCVASCRRFGARREVFFPSAKREQLDRLVEPPTR